MSGTLKKPLTLPSKQSDMSGGVNPNFPIGFNRDDPDSGPSQGPHQVGRLGSPQKIAPTSTLDPKKAKKCLVGLLDGNEYTFLVNPDCLAEELLDEVCKYLQLNEKEYFGITYKVDRNDNIPQAFLELKKPLEKQLKKAIQPKMEFRVKFYPSDPTSLNETTTKYCITCQVRMDIITGKLPVTFQTYCILGSYNAQADLGDLDVSRHAVPGYLRNMPFAPPNLQSNEMIEQIAALHSQHQGMEPERADHIYLDNARRLALYGLHLYDCKNSSNEDLRVGVFHGGFVTYRGSIRIQRYSWPKIIKFSWDKKKFVLVRRPFEGESGDVDESFTFDSLENAKRFYKVMVDHHQFFRMREQQGPSRPKLNPRNPMFNPNTMRRPGEGDDDYYGATAGQDWGTVNTIARPGVRRPDADWGELPNISKNKSLSGSKGSLGPDSMNRTDTTALAAEQAARAKMLEEQQRALEEQRRQQEELARRQQEEYQRQQEEQRRQQEEMARRMQEEQRRQQEEMARRMQEQYEASKRAAAEQQERLEREYAAERERAAERQRQLEEERLQNERLLEEKKRAQQMAFEEQLRKQQQQLEEERRQKMLQMEEERREQQRQMEEEQRRRDEDARRAEEERRNAEEKERRRLAELEQQRLAEENKKQLAMAAALGVDPSLVPFLSGLLRDIANQSQFKKETERHEMFTSQMPPPSRGSDGPEPTSIGAGSTGNNRKTGANQVSMWRLPPKQVQVLFKMQVGDPDEEFGSALASVLGALDLDQTALVIGDVNLNTVQCSLGPPPGGVPSPAASAVPGGPAIGVLNSIRTAASADLLSQSANMPPPPGRASRPPAPPPSSRGQTLV